jgi:DNA-binding NtrC family response regulator
LETFLQDTATHVPTLIGQSSRLQEVRALVRKLGRSDSPVLLLGETGTGKEVAARAIHESGGCGPFVPIDCSLLGTLLESELFGHTRGAFTGAVASKAGLLELAEGGTAFFDEIGELPVDTQAKLLRVLQEKEIRPLGGLAGRKARFRLIAATNRDLAREVELGRFRRDLYYRLNVVTLRLPPLRDRKEDIPELAAHFLARYGRGHELTQPLLEAMSRYDWPGNVRELENCIQRMVAINSGPYLHSADLPSALQGALLASQAESLEALVAAAGADGLPAPRIPARGVMPLEELERHAIVEALAHTRGDRARAAVLLGIGRTTLYRKLKQYQL